MFFGKKKKEAPPAAAAAPGPEAVPEPEAPVAVASAPPAGEAAAPPARDSASGGKGRGPHMALGQIAGLMAGSPVFQQAKLSDLNWLVVPAIRSNQVAIAEARDAAGNAVPVAAVLWAQVSVEVDQRLTSNATFPPQLRAEDWNSGDIPWIVMVLGAEKACEATIVQVSRKRFEGRKIKMSVRDANGLVAVKELSIAA